MSGRSVVLIVIFALGLAVIWLQRTNRKTLGGSVLTVSGAILLADALLVGPIPGAWELTGICGVVLGIRMLLEGRATHEHA